MASILSCFAPHETQTVHTIYGTDIQVIDETSKRAAAIFRRDLTEKNEIETCQIKIKNNPLVKPTVIKAKYDDLPFFYLFNSKEIYFKREVEDKNKFIQIRQIDKAGKESIFYADYTTSLEKGVYPVYCYKPDEILEEEAIEKVLKTQKDHPEIGFSLAAYNRHGVVMFGFTKKTNSYVLYWVSPEDHELKEVECETIARWADGGSSTAKSKDEFINFNYYLDSESYFLNSEKAKPVFIPQHRQH